MQKLLFMKGAGSNVSTWFFGLDYLRNERKKRTFVIIVAN